MSFEHAENTGVRICIEFAREQVLAVRQLGQIVPDIVARRSLMSPSVGA
ncbi:hypothetical protein [Blastomonas fulva]